MQDSQAHSPAMGQEDCEKWTAAAHLQPAMSKSDSLLVSWRSRCQRSGLPYEGRLQLHASDAVNLAVNVMIPTNEPDATHFGTDLYHLG